MRLQEYLKKLPDSRSKEVLDSLLEFATASPAASQFRYNILSEERLTARECRVLVRALERAHRVRAYGSLEGFIRKFSRRKRGLKGEIAEVPKDAIYFRAISFDRFFSLLYEMKLVSSLDDAIQFVELAIEQPSDLTRVLFSGLPLGKFVMWSSFYIGSVNNPGDPTKCKPSDLLCSLGLEMSDQLCLLFRYNIPPDIDLRVPTVWDAYSTDVWNLYFRICYIGDPHGLTMPTMNCSSMPRPEVVHVVIDGGNLAAPVSLLA